MAQLITQRSLVQIQGYSLLAAEVGRRWTRGAGLAGELAPAAIASECRDSLARAG